MGIRDTKTKRFAFEITFYLTIGGMILFLATFGGFALGGFEESFFSNFLEIQSYLGSYIIYIPLIIIALLLPLFSLMNYLFIRDGEHPSTQENPSWLRIFTVSYIFNPEHSALWFLAKQFKDEKNIKWTTNVLRVILISILFFGTLGIFQIFFPQLSISGVPQAQQITTASDIFFGAGLPSFAENGTLLFILSLLSGINAFLCAKFIKDKRTAMIVFFMVALLFIAPLMGLGWMQYHSLVYGNSEADLMATFIFGWLGATITILTGICFFWLIWHFINNLTIKLIELATFKEDIALISGLILFVILVIYIWFEVRTAKKKKSPEQAIVS